MNPPAEDDSVQYYISDISNTLDLLENNNIDGDRESDTMTIPTANTLRDPPTDTESIQETVEQIDHVLNEIQLLSVRTSTGLLGRHFDEETQSEVSSSRYSDDAYLAQQLNAAEESFRRRRKSDNSTHEDLLNELLIHESQDEIESSPLYTENIEQILQEQTARSTEAPQPTTSAQTWYRNPHYPHYTLSSSSKTDKSLNTSVDTMTGAGPVAVFNTSSTTTTTTSSSPSSNKKRSRLLRITLALILIMIILVIVVIIKSTSNKNQNKATTTSTTTVHIVSSSSSSSSFNKETQQVDEILGLPSTTINKDAPLSTSSEVPKTTSNNIRFPTESPSSTAAAYDEDISDEEVDSDEDDTEYREGYFKKGGGKGTTPIKKFNDDDEELDAGLGPFGRKKKDDALLRAFLREGWN